MFYKFLYCVPQEQLVHLMSKLIKPKKKSEHLIINRLAAVLKEERILNKDLAETLGYEPATVSKWGTNTIQPPLSTFLRIALTINRDLRDFFVTTKDIDEAEKSKLLKELAIIAKKGKRTGKDNK
jgi:transcriptional regulator with XRE-family HTH domain